jgi:hypothetical protein
MTNPNKLADALRELVEHCDVADDDCYGKLNACAVRTIAEKALAEHDAQPAPAPVQAEHGLTSKQAWWAGARIGLGLPPDCPRTEVAAALAQQRAQSPSPAADGAGELPPLPELPPIRDRQSIEDYATAYARAAIAALRQPVPDVVRELPGKWRREKAEILNTAHGYDEGTSDTYEQCADELDSALASQQESRNAD